MGLKKPIFMNKIKEVLRDYVNRPIELQLQKSSFNAILSTKGIKATSEQIEDAVFYLISNGYITEDYYIYDEPISQEEYFEFLHEGIAYDPNTGLAVPLDEVQVLYSNNHKQ